MSLTVHLSIAGSLLALAGCGQFPDLPVVSVDPAGAIDRTKIDLGSVQQGARLTRELCVRNPTSRDVQIVRFASTCECGVMLPAQLTVAADGDATCELDVDLQKDPRFVGGLGIEIDGRDQDDRVVLKLVALLDVRPARPGTGHAEER